MVLRRLDFRSPERSRYLEQDLRPDRVRSDGHLKLWPDAGGARPSRIARIQFLIESATKRRRIPAEHDDPVALLVDVEGNRQGRLKRPGVADVGLQQEALPLNRRLLELRPG